MNQFQQLREQKGMSQAQLANTLGLDRSTIAKWETGTSMPRANLLPKLAELLGCTVDELLRPQAEEKEKTATPA